MPSTTTRTRAARQRALAILDGYEPVGYLWQSGAYPSEQSARWALRTHRAELLAAGALALHRGRLYVHLGRFSAVIERAAVERASAAHDTSGGGGLVVLSAPPAVRARKHPDDDAPPSIVDPGTAA